MPYEVGILVPLPRIATLDEAVQMSHRVYETVTNACLTTSGLPGEEVVVRSLGITEYDADTDEVLDTIHFMGPGDPAELPSEETQQKIRDGIDQAHRGETKDLGSFTQYLDDTEGDADPAYCERGPNVRSECGNPADYDVWISLPDGTTGIILRHCATCADRLTLRFESDPTRTVHRAPITKGTP